MQMFAGNLNWTSAVFCSFSSLSKIKGLFLTRSFVIIKTVLMAKVGCFQMIGFIAWLYNILTGGSRWLRKQMSLWEKLGKLKISLDGQDKPIYCWSRCQTPWIGIDCSSKPCGEEPQSTTREESQHSLYKLSSQVFLVSNQPAHLIPTAINMPLPLLICTGMDSKKLRRWRSICNHSSAPLAPSPLGQIWIATRSFSAEITSWPPLIYKNYPLPA